MNQQKQGVYHIDGHVIDADRRLILAAGKEVEIQPRAFDVLIYLLKNRDRAVSKEELQEDVWPGQFISETVMARAIMKARKAVGDDAHSQTVIKTLHGYGYRFVAEPKFTKKSFQKDTENTDPQIHHDYDSGDSETRTRPPFVISRRSLVFITLVVAMAVVWLARDSLHNLYDTNLTNDKLPRVSANRWPEAEVFFHQNPRWLGGSLAPSVDLGGGRVAWFFGNSYVSEDPGQSRRDATYISNAIGIQHGYYAPTATLEVFWQTRESAPASFFTEKDGKWYWPLQAALVDKGVVLFLQETRKTSEGLGFEPTKIISTIIENHADSPDRWVFKPMQLTKTDADQFINMSSLYTEGDYLYVFSRRDPGRDAYLARWLKKSVGSTDTISSEWWCGEELGWQVLADDLSRARPVISDASHQFHIQFLPEQNKHVLVEGWGFPTQVLSMRSADTLTGTWSERTIIFRPEERYRPGVYVHGIGVHPGLQGADIIATYNVNHEIFSQQLVDTTVLYPRFVRINFEPGR